MFSSSGIDFTIFSRTMLHYEVDRIVILADKRTYQIGTISLNNCSPQKTDFESCHDGADTHQSCKDGIHFVIFILKNSSDERS